MFFRVVALIACLMAGVANISTAGEQNVQRYKMVNALHDSVMSEYYRLPCVVCDTTDIGYSLSVLGLTLEIERCRQLLAMSEMELRQCVPSTSMLMTETADWRRQMLTGQIADSQQLLDLVVRMRALQRKGLLR